MLTGVKMNRSDPYSPDESCYECRSCGARTVTDGHLGSCPECDGDVRNIAVPRE